jgi:hypothetical protein
MNTYNIYYNGGVYEREAKTPSDAKESFIADLKVPKSKQGLISTVLVAVDGREIIHSGAEL